LNISKNLYVPIILIAIAIAVVSNFGSVISVIEHLTYTNIYISNSGTLSIASFWCICAAYEIQIKCE
jgi:hypothetical protein